MARKIDVLNAWITIEQLSEGSIKKNDEQLRIFNQPIMNGFDRLFINFLIKQKEKEEVSDHNFKKSGLVFYFDIFNFQEIIAILREKYKISDTTDEEIDKSDKFTFAMYFDHQLNFISEKLFFTMSRYIRYKGELPIDFFNAEDSLRADLSKQFEDKVFNDVITNILRQYKVSLANCRYGFVKNLENDNVNLHSFFIDDLQKAKNINTKNLDRYFAEYTGSRGNLDSKIDSPNFNSEIFQEILQPKFYPLGRFPSNSDYALSLMQEVAVNLALNEKNALRSVNGPPGTGKTTLLKDIFADLVVQQAVEICKLSDKKIKGSLIYWEKAKLGVLPNQLSDKNIVVASSNNGAVQNIVNELPQIDGISEEFSEQLLDADYFKTIANSKLEVKWAVHDEKKTKALTGKFLEETNWGVFSLEGGTSTNVNNLLLNIEFINDYLKNEYQPNPAVYQEFLKSYKSLFDERTKIQTYYEQIRELQKLTIEYEKAKNYYFINMTDKKNKLKLFNAKTAQKLILFQKNNEELSNELNITTKKIASTKQECSQIKDNLDIIKLQKPSLLWIKKIIKKEQVNRYFENLNSVNEKLNSCMKQRRVLLDLQIKIEQQLEKNLVECNLLQKQIEKEKNEFDNWINIQEHKMSGFKQQIKELTTLKINSNIEELDFSQSYEKLQKSNPWFTKEFRIAQSELFISALKVRKQFLYENSKHLATAVRIWSRQKEYISKVNGQQLLTESWQWINFAIPVISTTFASFGRMFKNIGENSIGNLFIDEAGQASPQASVGAIFRSKKVMVVGDPSQIKPVLTLDSNVLNLLGQNYRVDEKFVSTNVSVQSLVDSVSQYGFQKSEHEWIGIPLWVHRRSNYPMFTISNEISYDGLMVQGKSEEESQGKSKWFNVDGKANDKFVREQAIYLKEKITERLRENSELSDDIYVITPFRNVAYKLAKELDHIGFTKREKGKPINVGTVHTFQGKEADVVYFVLGADISSKGAARWAVSESNIMNVAATRAKEEFYIIGDKKMYSSIGSKVANMTIAIIDHYNRSGGK